MDDPITKCPGRLYRPRPGYKNIERVFKYVNIIRSDVILRIIHMLQYLLISITIYDMFKCTIRSIVQLHFVLRNLVSETENFKF